MSITQSIVQLKLVGNETNSDIYRYVSKGCIKNFFIKIQQRDCAYKVIYLINFFGTITFHYLPKHRFIN